MIAENKVLFTLIKEHKWEDVENILKKSDDRFDVNIRDQGGNFILQYVIMFNKIDIVELLLKMGAELDLIIDDRSILFIPIKYKFYKIIDLLLRYNEKSIGVSIVHIKDSDDKTALHYAVAEQDLNIVKKLLRYGSDINSKDKDGLTPLHTAVINFKKSLDIIKTLLKVDDLDIDSSTNTGESALHLACNREAREIVRLLLAKNINIDTKDRDHEFTPLMYSINLGDIETVKILIQNKADPNIQDYLGNTALHHSLKDNRLNIVELLVTSTKINYNMHNIEGRLPIHILLEKGMKLGKDKVGKFIINSNLNFQNGNGDSPLHLLMKVWKDYRDILAKKKLNIFLQNKDGVRPIDLVDESSKKEFIQLVVDSYLYVLRNTGFVWKETWENICSKPLTDKEERELDRYLGSKDKGSKDKCRSIVYDKLVKIVDRDGSTCDNLSYPIRQDKRCIHIKEGVPLSFCTFTGATIDILFGLIYLLKKHKSVCSTLDKDFVKNRKLCEYYEGLVQGALPQCQFLNFEIVWSYKKLFFSSNFESNFQKCSSNPKKRFIVIPIGIELDNGAHGNYLIYDKKLKEIERFEPYGSGTPYKFDYKPRVLDSLLSEKFKQIDKDIVYISPEEYMPKIGFQYFDVVEGTTGKIGDPGGFCALWSLWYTDQRVTYHSIDRRYLVGQLLKNIRKKNISFKNLIRDYSKDIIEIRDTVLSKAGISINDWLNEQYTQEQYMNIIRYIVTIVDEYS